MDDLQETIKEQRIAYFSMEIGLRNDAPTYAGGLGVLAGDTIRTSADLEIPLVAVTLVSKRGYFRQEITRDGRQIEHPQDWDPSKLMKLLPAEATVQIQNRNVKVKPWLYVERSVTGGIVPVLFLDTDVEGNTVEDREITHFLYGRDERYRLKQEIVLGIGGVRILNALGFKIRKYHMNEGHSSLLALELLHQHQIDIEKVHELCVFTTHTPVESGHDRFPYDVVGELMGKTVSLEVLRRFGGQESLNSTLLALNLSNYVNGVAKRHRDTSRKMFRGYDIHAITNGVHPHTWTCASFRRVYDKYIPGWANEPELLVRVETIPDEDVWQAHKEAKEVLINRLNKAADTSMDGNTLTLGFVRRATGYKRADLLFSDLKRLRQVNREGRIQLIFAGKAHPRDESGKKLITQIFGYIKNLKDEIKIAYLENYDMDLAAELVSGVDVWLNTPLPPFEASGTSGMKAALNGVINFSVLDGWWVEGWIEGVTGWAIGPHPDLGMSAGERQTKERDDLYNKLEYLIIPEFYQRRDEWIRMMKNSVGKIAYYFNSHRMMRRYVTEAYL